MKLHAESKKGIRPGAIVFLHGNSSSSRVYDPIFSDSMAYSLHRFDFPGHGRSAISTDGHSYEVKNLRKAIVDYCEGLGEPYLLVGNSLGGHLGIQCTPELSNCKGLVIFGTPPLKVPINIEEAFHPVDALNTYLKPDFTPEELDSSLDVAAHNKQVIPLLKEDFISTDPNFREIWVKSALEMGQFLNEVDILKDISIPVYVIYAKDDPTPRLDYIKALEGITKIYELDECGHYASIEAPDKFNPVVRKIAEEVLG